MQLKRIADALDKLTSEHEDGGVTTYTNVILDPENMRDVFRAIK